MKKWDNVSWWNLDPIKFRESSGNNIKYIKDPDLSCLFVIEQFGFTKERYGSDISYKSIGGGLGSPEWFFFTWYMGLLYLFDSSLCTQYNVQ